jgi:hypothetical protein
MRPSKFQTEDGHYWTDPGRCLNCYAEVEPKGIRREPSYWCSASCKAQHWRRTQATEAWLVAKKEAKHQ